jgi:3-oxoacyl-[acyl-carrier protein] reductase
MNKKVAVITGGSRGIGRSVALKLAQQGFDIALTYAGQREKAETVADEVRLLGADALVVKFDLSDLADGQALLPAVKEHFGRVDVLIANAYGTSIFKPLTAVTETDYDTLFAYTKGTFFLLQQAANLLPDGGRILVFSTGATQMPGPGSTLYAGSKAAIERFALGLAKELGGRQITVNVVSPGVTKTDGLVAPQPMIDYLVGQTPLGRLGEPDDVADVVAMLTSEAGRWINMQIIKVNGGIL